MISDMNTQTKIHIEIFLKQTTRCTGNNVIRDKTTTNVKGFITSFPQ